jgi:hypothetical protein
MRKAYGFRTFRITEIALYHALGNLPQPHAAHRFLLTNQFKDEIIIIHLNDDLALEHDQYDDSRQLLCGPIANAFALELDRAGWMIVPKGGNKDIRWTMSSPSPHRPAWADPPWDAPPQPRPTLKIIDGGHKNKPTEP